MQPIFFWKFGWWVSYIQSFTIAVKPSLMQYQWTSHILANDLIQMPSSVCLFQQCSNVTPLSCFAFRAHCWSDEWCCSISSSITASHVTSVVRATHQVNGRRQNYPSHHPTPPNRQSPNIAHVIMTTTSPHTPHLVKVTPGVTSPHIAKVTTHFFKNFCVRKSLSTDLELRPLNRFWHVIHQQTRTHVRLCLLGVRGQYFHILTLKTPQNPIFGPIQWKPMQNTYSHNCMIHRDTKLKFGALFDLAK